MPSLSPLSWLFPASVPAFLAATTLATSVSSFLNKDWATSHIVLFVVGFVFSYLILIWLHKRQEIISEIVVGKLCSGILVFVFLVFLN